MNKENAIKKINKMGQVGHVIAIVLNVLVSLVFVLLLISTIVFKVLPDDFVTVDTTTDVSVGVNLNPFLANASDAEIESIRNALVNDGKNGNLSIDGVGYATQDITFDNNQINIETVASTTSFTSKTICFLLGLALLGCVAYFVTFFFAGRLCKAFKVCSSPFETGVIKNIQYFAYSLIPWIFVDSLISGITEILDGGNSYNFTVNFTVIFIVLVLLALAYIFKYGAILQTESDETL